MNRRYRRYFLQSGLYRNLPLFIESAGWNQHQKEFRREQGYPYYHWLQTAEGVGEFSYSGGEPFELPPHHGVMLFPDVSHWYRPTGDSTWSTYYITFGGIYVQQIMEALDVHHTGVYRWEPGSPMDLFLHEVILKIEQSGEYSGLDASLDVYSFFVHLKKYGQMNRLQSYSGVETKLRPLLDWLEHNYSNSDIGLEQMAEVAGMSSQRLNALFHQRYGNSPYSYLIQFRIRKAKELLAQDHTMTIADVARMVGFRDPSHFVLTFRKQENITPAQFRKLHESGDGDQT